MQVFYCGQARLFIKIISEAFKAMFPSELTELTSDLIAKCREVNIKIATAESCTGGLIAGCLTSVSGSSDVFERGFNTYSNEAKNEMLGVPIKEIFSHGAVSESVAKAMCEGALKNAPVQLTVAVTGIAGPGGGTPEKPVGLVYVALAAPDGEWVEPRVWNGNRWENKERSAEAALELLYRYLKGRL